MVALAPIGLRLGLVREAMVLVVIDVAGGKAFEELTAAVKGVSGMVSGVHDSVASKRRRVRGASCAEGEGRAGQLSGHGESCDEIVVDLVDVVPEGNTTGNACGDEVDNGSGVS